MGAKMYDILIIGSGPAGLSAAVYAQRASLSVAVVEKEYGGSGQIAESGRVDNYLGIPGISGFELGEKFRAHAASLGASFVEKEVTGIALEKDENEKPWYRVKYDDGTSAETKAVIYAAGAAPRRMGVKEEERFLGKGISYCAICDGGFFKNKTVAVLGGGDTALDDALYLSDVCAKVYLIHRRESFRGAQSTLDRVRERDNIELVLNETVEEIYGEKRVMGLITAGGRDIEVSGIFVAYGSVPRTTLLKELVKLDERGYVIAGEDGMCLDADGKVLEGFFVAGDVRTKSLRQVVTAVSDGANAASSAVEYLWHRAALRM